MSTTAKASADRARVIVYATIGVVVVALVGLIGYFSRPNTISDASKAPVLAQLKVGDVAPDFSLSTTQGPFQLSRAHDEPTLLEVFATWCPHCQRETLVLNALYAENKDHVHFVTVNGSSSASEQDPNVPETQADVIAFGQRFGVRYPLAYDADLTVANKYLLGGFPTIVLIGKDGKVQALASGEVPSDAIDEALHASLAGRAPKPAFGTQPQP